MLTIFAVAGCGYGEVSPETYQYAKALYSLSNRQQEERLAMVEEKIAAAAESGEISSTEAGWLQAICADCRSGDWQKAQSAARRIMQDQVRP